jgi:hypothetical protein
MKIFILEDNYERIKKFDAFYKNHELIFSDNVADALLKLVHTEFDILMLDHDLDENNLTSYNNGYELCKKMIEFNLQKQAIIYIHSMNPSGANAMLNILKDNGYRVDWYPYHLLKLEE